MVSHVLDLWSVSNGLIRRMLMPRTAACRLVEGGVIGKVGLISFFPPAMAMPVWLSMPSFFLEWLIIRGLLTGQPEGRCVRSHTCIIAMHKMETLPDLF